MRRLGALIGLGDRCRSPPRRWPRIPRHRMRHGARPCCRDLPDDAAKRVFGQVATPRRVRPGRSAATPRAARPARCALPPDGPAWQVMRPSRNRFWGQPALIAAIEELAGETAAVGWPGLLVGDVAQPRGGPMITGHESHQIGLDVDVWLTPMPDRRLTAEERDTVSASNLVSLDGNGVDPALWGPQYSALYETAARMPQTARIFVNAAIKRQLCREAGADRDWLRLHPAVVGPQRPFPLAHRLPERRDRMREPGPAAARRRLRQGARLVVHRRGPAPEARPAEAADTRLRPAPGAPPAPRSWVRDAIAARAVNAAAAPSSCGCGRRWRCARCGRRCRGRPGARPRCRRGRSPRRGARTRPGSRPARRAPRRCGRRACSPLLIAGPRSDIPATTTALSSSTSAA